MNFPEAIAMSALVIGIISVAGIWLDAYKSRMSNRTRELELKVRMAQADRGAGVQRMGEVEDRLRVLERIATDRKLLLADEIEALRTPSASHEEIAR